MGIRISEKELDLLDTSKKPAVIVHSGRSKKGYAVISQTVYDQVRPLLQYVTLPVDAGSGKVDASNEWTEEKNACRVALINKKYDQGLTAAEKKELQRLQAEVDEFADRAAPVRNEVLELLLLGLKQAAKARKR
jgi:hypothetical protein